MKVLYLSNSILPSRSANSIHVMKMCRAFSAHGHAVTLMAPGYDAHYLERGITNIFQYYGVEPTFLVKKPRCLYSSNFPTYLLATIQYSAAIARELKRLRPDIVYGRYLPGCLAGAIMGYPTIYEAHGQVWEATLEWPLFRLFARSRGFRYLVVISEVLKRLYLSHTSLEQSRIRVAHDSADPVPDEDRLEPWPGRRGALQVGYFGSLFRGRGMGLIVQLAQALPDMDFHIVGGSDEDIAGWQNQIRLANMFFHGFVAPRILHLYRNGCDVLLAPYRDKVAVYGGAGDTSSFMSPLKIFEYMSSGRPMVVSDLPVLREVLNDENAILVPPHEEQQWIDALVKLQDPAVRSALAGKALADFRSAYTWERRAELVLAGMTEPLANRERP